MFESEFCKVEYLQNINAVLCTWKKYCEFNDYREPLQNGLKLINKHSATTWITDTSNGFESTSEDNQWLATEFSPQAINSTCKKVVFIIKSDSPLKNEIESQSQLLKQFFEIELVEKLANLKKC